MANPDHLKILRQGVKEWNEWRKTNPLVKPDLSGAKLKGAKLWGINLHHADLRGANLKSTALLKSNLIEADLRDSIMEDTRLMIAEMWGVNLRGANLKGADMRMAEIGDANLIGCILKNANLGRANLMASDLTDANLENTILIETNLNDTILDNTNLTGMTFYRCTSYGWKLSNISCDYMFTDVARKSRYPKNGNFNPGEFEEIYKSKPTIEFTFEHPITWVDSLILEVILSELEIEKPELGIKLISYDSRGGQSRAILTIPSLSMEEEAQAILRDRYDIKAQLVESRMDYMLQFIVQATREPGEEKLLESEIEKLRDIHNHNISICTNAIREIQNVVQKQPDEILSHQKRNYILAELDHYLRLLEMDGPKVTGEKIMTLAQIEMVPILPRIITQLAVLTISKQD